MPPLHSSQNFAFVLQSCHHIRDPVYAPPLLAYVHRYGLPSHKLLGKTLLSTFAAHLGCIENVLLVSASSVQSDHLLWCTLVQELVKQGHPHHALTHFRKMQGQDSLFRPCSHTIVALLKACAKLKDLDSGMEIHEHIATFALDDKNVFVGTALVDMYAKCGCLLKARDVFRKMPIRNVVTWTALITGCIEQGHDEDALCCFEQMYHTGIIPDAGTFVCALKACAGVGNLGRGRVLNDEIIKRGLDGDNFVGNTLVDMYSRCDFVADAHAVFHALSDKDVVSWNAFLTGFIECGPHELVLSGIERMGADGFSPNEITFVCALKACGSLGALGICRDIHGQVLKIGSLDLFIVSTLIDAYSKCGSLAEARNALSTSRARDVVAWNAMIGGYIEHDFHEEALSCFKLMEDECISQDVCTYAYVLKACSCISKTYIGCILHAEIVMKGLEKDLMIGRTLIDMYASFGSIVIAQYVHNNIHVRNTFTWNALIIGYMELGDHKQVLSCSEQMGYEGIPPDYVTLVCSLGSCAQLGMSSEGQILHVELVKKGMEKELFQGNALADMYINCGLFREAQDVFNRLSHRNVVMWTALMAGYAQLGDCGTVCSLFLRMREEGHCPDSVAFLTILNACNHGGLLDEGERCFISISVEFFVVPTIEHFTCMMDLFGRSGDMKKAVHIIDNMPYHPSLAMWNTMLWACRKWENVELAKTVFDEALQLNDRDIATYISLSNIYAKSQQNDAAWSKV